MGEFGEKFRKAREKKELSLDDVSSVTKIGTRMLQAIEEEHFDLLPGGVFNKGFIRAYAKHLGLDSEDAVNDYLACLRQAQVDSHAGWDATQYRDPHTPAGTNGGVPRPLKPAAKAQEPVPVEELPDLQLPRIEHVRPPRKEYLGRPSSGVPWMRIAIAICLLMVAFFFWTRHSRKARMSAAMPPAADSAPSTVSAAPPQVTPTPTSSAPPATNPAPAPQPSRQSSQPSAPTLDSANRKPALTPQPEPSADPDAVKAEKKSDVTTRSFAATADKPAETSATRLTLVVRASETSWISVTSDGQLVTQETLIAPAATSFHATRELVVRVGNAAGVTFIWNGEEFPPQGSEAEAKTFIFDAQGMRAATTSQPAPQP